MPTKSILEIAKSAVPEHLRESARLIVHPTPSPAPGPAVALAAGKRARGRRVPTTADVAAKLAARLGVKLKKRAAVQSGDVEFIERTRLGKRSIVVQVRSGKVKQIIKRAAR